MPAVKLTNRLIEAAVPQAKPFELWDTEQRGLLLKITPAGNRVFMVFYRAPDGTKRKPRIGAYGQVTLAQARAAALQILGEVALRKDPSRDRQQERQAPNVGQLAERYLRDVALQHSKPSYLRQQRRMVETRIKPPLGTIKVAAVTRSDILALHNRLRETPYEANRVLALVSVLFNQAELWGLRPEGSNPCRLIKRFREQRRERLLSDEEVARIFAALEHPSEHPSVKLAILLLFATACRASEILGLRWEYIDQEAGELVWHDSKTGALRKPLTGEIAALLSEAERIVGNPFVCVGIKDRAAALPMSTLEKAWRRILARAGAAPCGLHAIRHRAATEIANSGLPIQVGMRLTGHRTAGTYLRYLHTEREQVRQAAEMVAQGRRRARSKD
jgi:integrase